MFEWCEARQNAERQRAEGLFRESEKRRFQEQAAHVVEEVASLVQQEVTNAAPEAFITARISLLRLFSHGEVLVILKSAPNSTSVSGKILKETMSRLQGASRGTFRTKLEMETMKVVNAKLPKGYQCTIPPIITFTSEEETSQK